MIPESRWIKQGKMNFFSSYVSPYAYKYVRDVLSSGMLSEGQYVREFEISLEQRFKLPKNSVVCVNSGTSALHIALATLNIKHGDEVILPPLTFVSTALAVLYVGAIPVFCDIKKDGTISPIWVAQNITSRTKAVIAVNWVGKNCDLEALQEICQIHGLKLIVDAAQSLGHGMGGDITCLSFQATKHLTTGDGGAVICFNQGDYERARKLSWFGISKEHNLPGELGERVYSLTEVGFKYHMNNIAAAIGLANLEMFGTQMFHRNKIADIYGENLKYVQPLHYNSAFWAYPIWTNDVYEFTAFCKENNIPVSNIHRGIDCHPIFSMNNIYSLTNMRWWEEHVTHLPIHHEISENDAYEICDKINRGIK